MNNQELLDNLFISECFDRWIGKKKNEYTFYPITKNQLVLAYTEKDNRLLTFMYFGMWGDNENKWDVSVDVDNGNVNKVIQWVIRRLK